MAAPADASGEWLLKRGWAAVWVSRLSMSARPVKLTGALGLTISAKMAERPGSTSGPDDSGAGRPKRCGGVAGCGKALEIRGPGSLPHGLAQELPFSADTIHFVHQFGSRTRLLHDRGGERDEKYANRPWEVNSTCRLGPRRNP